MIPCSCAWANPDNTCRVMSTARAIGSDSDLRSSLRFCTVDELHHHVRTSIVDPHVDHATDVRVLELRHRQGFAFEPSAGRFVGNGLVEHLDRDDPAELDALSAIDAAHRALADPLEYAVALVE